MSLKKVRNEMDDARLSGLEVPESGAWGQTSRGNALTRVRQMGLAGRRDEYWKYTDPKEVNAAEVKRSALPAPVATPAFAGLDCLNIVFVDGVFDSAASDDLTAEGVEIERLGDAMERDIHWARDVYGVLEQAGQDPVQRPYAAMNTAIASDGVVIRATSSVSKPIKITYRQQELGSDAFLHHVIRVEEGAEVTLLESGAVAARLNVAMEVEIADKASFHHIRLQGPDHDRLALTHIFAKLGEESAFKSFTFTANGVLTRNECVITLTGDDAMAHVAGAAIGDGDFHHDDTVFITHDAERCESRQVFKKVLRNGATGVFQGKILVKHGAQKTDGYQISQALLLDDDAQFLAKPELEIYADDVACSHGSTSGAIDDEALFYLRSRGVPTDVAQNLLVLAFLAEALDEIDDDAIRDSVLGTLTEWLEGHTDA